MQWSADVTEHTHVEEIKVPAHAGNNQNYYSQIVRHLDQLDKCFRFDLVTYVKEYGGQVDVENEDFSDGEEGEEHELDAGTLHLSEYLTPTCQVPNYFSSSSSLLLGEKPTALKPYRTFATSTTSFHLATKPSLWSSVDEAAITYQLPDLNNTIATFFANEGTHFQGQQPCIDKLQIWHKMCVQLMSYHNAEIVQPPQTLHAIPSLTMNPYGQYDSVIISPNHESDWPKNGITGHSVAQLHMIFHFPHLDLFLAYVHHFNIVPHSDPTNIDPATGMHMLKWAARGNGQCVGEIIPLIHVRSPAHIIPNFGRGAHSRLTKLSSYELSNEFWLNKYWLKEFYYVLSPS